MKVVICRGFIRLFRLLYMRLALKRRIEDMAAWRRAIALSLEDEDIAKLRSMAQSRSEPASRVERARILLAYWEKLSLFCREPRVRAASSDGAALRRARRGGRPDGGARRSPAARSGAHHHHRGQGVAGRPGVPQGQGTGLSARTVDDAAVGQPCPRAWTGRRASEPRQPGAGHGVQDPR